MNLVKVISSEVNDIKQRLVKILRFGKVDVQTPIQSAPYGLDSNPIKDMIAVYSGTQNDDSKIIIGYLNKDSLAKPGEYRTFATDKNGALKFYTWMKDDGTYEIGGNTNFAVKYNELLQEYNKTKAYLLTLKSSTAALAIVLDGIVPGTSTMFNASMSAISPGDFSLTKNSVIKTIG
jgi:hypothetical protein